MCVDQGIILFHYCFPETVLRLPGIHETVFFWKIEKEGSSIIYITIVNATYYVTIVII